MSVAAAAHLKVVLDSDSQSANGAIHGLQARIKQSSDMTNSDAGWTMEEVGRQQSFAAALGYGLQQHL